MFFFDIYFHSPKNKLFERFLYSSLSSCKSINSRFLTFFSLPLILIVYLASLLKVSSSTSSLKVSDGMFFSTNLSNFLPIRRWVNYTLEYSNIFCNNIDGSYKMSTYGLKIGFVLIGIYNSSLPEYACFISYLRLNLTFCLYSYSYYFSLWLYLSGSFFRYTMFSQNLYGLG